MATKYYIWKTDAPDISPTPRNWSDYTGVIRRKMKTSLDTLSGSTDQAAAETSTSSTYTRCLVQAITDKLGPMTISGTVSAQFQFMEDVIAANMFAEIQIDVYSATGTYKSTILSMTIDGTEFVNAAQTNRTILLNATLTGQTMINGDRLVVEIGYQAQNTKSTSYTGTQRIGADSAYTDLPANDSQTGTTYRGWISFSQTHVDYNNPPTIVLNTADGYNFGADLTPTIEFTGSDVDVNDLRYQLQINHENVFAYDVSGSTDDGIGMDLGAYGTFAFGNDGTKLLTLNTNTKYIYEYTLSTAWNHATASLANSWYIGTIMSYPYHAWYNSDGTKIVIGSSGGVSQFVLSTAWNISTHGASAEKTGTTSGSDGPYWMNAANTKLFVPKAYTQVLVYTMTANDVSTLAQDAANQLPAAEDGYVNGCWLDPAGTTLITVGWANTSYEYEMLQYSLGTAFDLTTATRVGRLVLANQFIGMTANPDGTKLFTVDMVDSSHQSLRRRSANIFHALLYDELSGTDAGFANTVSHSPADTDPFTAGDKISYTVQADLTTGTYYWRARVFDTAAGGAWSAWAASQSFILEEPQDIIVYPPAADMTLTAQEIGLLIPGYAFIETVAMTLTPLEPTIEIFDPSIMRIRQEINILCHTLSAATGVAATSNEIILLDKSVYDCGTFYFEVVGYTSSSLAVDIKLRRKGTSTDDATCSIPAGTTAPRVFRSSSFTPQTTPTEYVVYVPDSAGATKYVTAARVVILQFNVPNLLTSETQIEIGNYETGVADQTPWVGMVPLAYPKYYTHTESRNALGACYLEMCWKVSNSGNEIWATLEQDDGSFANWVAIGGMDTDAGTGTTPMRSRSSRLKLIVGRHYRFACHHYPNDMGYTHDIYSAKIIVQQGSLGLRYLPPVGYNYGAAPALVSTDGQRLLVTSAKMFVGGGPALNYTFASGTGGDTWITIRGPEAQGHHRAAMSDDGKYILLQGRYFYNESLYIKTSNDYGQTWVEHTEMAPHYDGWGVAMSATGQYQYVYAQEMWGGNYGQSWYWKSDDYGATFDVKDTAVRAVGYAEAILCSDDGKYVAMNFGRFIRYSEDYGETWENKDILPTGAGTYSWWDLTMSRDGTTFLQPMTYGGVRKLMLSTDRGENWNDISAGHFPSGCTWIMWAGLGGTKNVVWCCFDDNNYNYLYIMRSEDYGVTWAEVPDTRRLWTQRSLAASEDESVVMILPYSLSQQYVAIVRKMDVRKISAEYLIENAYNNATGLANKDIKYEPAEWYLPNVTAKHAIDTGLNSPDAGAKLQTDPNGTPADISGSTTTGDYRVESSALASMASAATIDVNVTAVPIHASRLLVEYIPPIYVFPSSGVMTLTPKEPKIFPLLIPIPSVSMAMTAQIPTYYVPPKIYSYPPSTSMALSAKSPSITWQIGAAEALLARSIYRCILTGGAEDPPVADIELPLRSFSAVLNMYEDSYLLVSVPMTNESLEEAIAARMNGDLVIYKGYQMSDGTEQAEEIARGTVNDSRRDTGGRSSSMTISGYKLITLSSPKTMMATEVRSSGKLVTEKRVIAADVDLFLRCGDDYVYGTGANDCLTVGQIEYYISADPVQSDMIVTEL